MLGCKTLKEMHKINGISRNISNSNGTWVCNSKTDVDAFVAAHNAMQCNAMIKKMADLNKIHRYKNVLHLNILHKREQKKKTDTQ